MEWPSFFFISISINPLFLYKVLSNGKYKSILHRAVVNNKTTRISLAVSNGPSLDTVVEPAPELSQPSTYVGMTFKEYLELQQGNKLDGKTCLDRVRIKTMWTSFPSLACENIGNINAQII